MGMSYYYTRVLLLNGSTKFDDAVGSPSGWEEIAALEWVLVPRKGKERQIDRILNDTSFYSSDFNTHRGGWREEDYDWRVIVTSDDVL